MLIRIKGGTVRPVNHIPGKVRYLTYYLIFPKDKEQWCDQIEFCQPLDNFLKNTNFHKRPEICNSLLRRGEASWKDNNGTIHRITIEEETRPRVWGTKKLNIPN